MSTVLPMIDVDRKTVDGVLERAEPLLPPEDFAILKGLVDTIEQMMRLLRERGSTIARLRRLFGLSRSEKTADLVSRSDGTAPSTPSAEGASDPTPSDGSQPSTDAPNILPLAAATDDERRDTPALPTVDPKPKRKGHGRIAASAYRAAEHIAVLHDSLRPGDACLRCARGKVYDVKRPAPILRLVGRPPLEATCWDCQCLRCATCGSVYTARPPEEARGDKYDETAASMIALLRYGAGMPFHRLERLQRDFETPLPASTQWDIVNDRAALVEPVYDELVRLAAQGDVLHNDDSYMRILDFMGARRAKLLARGKLPDPERTGLFTTAVVAVVAAIGTIVLFFTGRKHAGENLADVLQKRAKDLPPPIQMGDALTRNLPEGHDVVDSNCIAHGRRKIVDEIENYPAECRFILDRLALVYKLDDECKKRNASHQERLLAHQAQSSPLMEEIRSYMAAQLQEKRIEPNSAMGQAFNYFLKRWAKFTLFLRKAGAPLDNNIAERALKRAIGNRNASLFYRSQRGAHVGDVYMTVLYTAELHGKNPFEYLTALQRNSKAVAESPADWMPWNYQQTLATLQPTRPTSPARRPAVPLAAA
jgi:hypothetical protein